MGKAWLAAAKQANCTEACLQRRARTIHLQGELDRLFDAVPTLPTHRAASHAFDVCVLRQPSGRSGAAIRSACASEAGAGLQGAFWAQCGVQPSCGSGAAPRTREGWLLARHRAEDLARAATADTTTPPSSAAADGGSHLVAALRRMRGRSLLWVGDSISRQLAEAARCEVGRAVGPGSADAAALQRQIVFADLTKHERSRDELTRRFSQLTRPARGEGGEGGELGGGGGAIVIANLGLHYNNRNSSERERSRELPRKVLRSHPRLAFGTMRRFHHMWDRQQFRSRTKMLLRLLDAFGRACDGCVGVYITTTTQHFDSPTGAFERKQREPTAYPCRALRASSSVQGAAADEHRHRTRADDDDAPPDPNAWRPGDALELAHQQSVEGRLVVLPIHRLTRPLWHAHLGVSRTGKAVDCSHFCPAPFLFDPLWFAVRMIAEAAFPSL